MSGTEKTSEAFEKARNQQEETIKRMPPEQRAHVEEIRRAAEHDKAELREEQAQRRDSDIAAERSRLLLEKPSLTLDLGEKATMRDLTSEELDGMAAYEVDRRNTMQLAAIDASADAEIAQFIEQQQHADEVSLTSSFDRSSEYDASADLGSFYTPAIERDGGIER